MDNDIVWQEPRAGFEFEPGEVVVTREHQEEKLACCGLAADAFIGQVDPSFFIGIGIHAGIRSGISAEGNVNMLQRLVQYRPVKLDETLIVKGAIRAVNEVPRGHTVETEVWFESRDGEKVIDASRTSLKPDPAKAGARGAGDRPPPVVNDAASLRAAGAYTLTAEGVKQYSSEGNSIHYEMAAANKAGFRAPIIGGGMGVHYLLHTLWREQPPKQFSAAIYFRRPVFWDDHFTVRIETAWQAACLAREDKVLTEMKLENIT